MKRSNLFTRIVPFLLLACCAFEIFIYDVKYFKEIQLLLSEIFGFGIIVMAKEIYLLIKYRACLYSVFASIGLLLCNVVNIAFLGFAFHYKTTIEDSLILEVALASNDYIGTFYDSVIILTALVLTVVFFIKEEIFCKLD